MSQLQRCRGTEYRAGTPSPPHRHLNSSYIHRPSHIDLHVAWQIKYTLGPLMIEQNNQIIAPKFTCLPGHCAAQVRNALKINIREGMLSTDISLIRDREVRLSPAIDMVHCLSTTVMSSTKQLRRGKPDVSSVERSGERVYRDARCKFPRRKAIQNTEQQVLC